MIALDKVIKSSNLLSSPIERICEIKKYLNTKDKMDFAKEYLDVVTKHVEDYPNCESFVAFIFFNLMVIKYYTNIDLKLTYEEFDALQSNGLINKIVDYIGEDYTLLLKLVQMSA